jgi:hypothetical protein
LQSGEVPRWRDDAHGPRLKVTRHGCSELVVASP